MDTLHVNVTQLKAVAQAALSDSLHSPWCDLRDGRTLVARWNDQRTPMTGDLFRIRITWVFVSHDND